VQTSYPCPKCGYPVVFAVRFCGNCGTFLNWTTQQSIQQKKTGAGLLTLIGLMMVGLLIVAGIFAYDSSSQAPVSSAVHTSQPQPPAQAQPLPQPQSLSLATPVLLSPGSNTDQGQVIDTITPSLQWNAVSGADYYSLIISKFPYNSGNIFCTPPQLAATSMIIPGGVLEYGQRYRWVVEAHNSTSPSSVSNALYFQTPQPSPLPLSGSTATTVPTNQPASTPPWTPVTLPGSSP
jgi:hypothetical protein